MYKIKLIFCFIVLAHFCNSQNHEILGRVVDAETGKPLAGANVIIVGTTNGTTTNHLGFFKIDNPKKTNLAISYIGYLTYQFSIPPSNNMLAKLPRFYQPLNRLDLRYFVLKNLSTIDGTANNEKSVVENKDNEGFKVVERNAVYSGGIDFFYNELGRLLKIDSIYQQIPDSLFRLKFTVAVDSSFSFNGFEPTLPKVEKFLNRSIGSFKKWTPAEQRGVQVPQYFEIIVDNSVREFFQAEVPAEPVGGNEQFEKYISKNLRYPKLARRMGVEGKVFVSFVVNENGLIDRVKVIKGVGAGCDEEAVRLISSCPAWIPGKHQGKTVKQLIVKPILFQL